MAEVVEGLDAERIAALRERDVFFWVDVTVDATTHERLGQVLGVPDHALDPLLDFREDVPPSRKFHVDAEHVVFKFSCFLEEGVQRTTPDYRLQVVEVHVLVCGDYVLTVHPEAVSLPEVLGFEIPEGRSEQYVVYAVLDAMTGSAFDALFEAELRLEALQRAATDMTASVRMGTLRSVNSRLSLMRRRLASQRGTFERISEEIGRVEGLGSDSERYFDRVSGQLDRLVRAIDAALDSMAKLVDLRLNETTYRLTAVATIFLPLTFVTGFFGMNFAWMIKEINSELAFVLLGIGTPVAAAMIAGWLIRRRGSPVEPDARPTPGSGAR